jgi:crotonobetaine/carnitine-CoA ligase
MTSVPEWIAERAEKNPDREFIVEAEGRSVTYGAFQEEALRWGAGFRGLGVDAGDTVVTMMPPSIDAFACWIGLSWIRAIDTGCNTEYQGRMLSYLFGNSQATVAVVAQRWLPRLLAIADELTCLKTVIVPDASGPLPLDAAFRVLTSHDLIADQNALTDLEPPSIWDTAMIIYTSGTTGPSKGVLISWGQQFATTCGVIPADSVDADDVFYSAFPMYHGSGRIGLCLMAKCNGKLVLRERFSGSQFWDDIRAFGCTTTALVGAMAPFLWNQEILPDDANNPLRRAIVMPVPTRHRDFEKRFGIVLRTTYSMTEISPPFDTGWDITVPDSCGRLRPGYQVRLVDEHDLDVPQGAIGELVVRHDEPWTLSSGYFGMPDKTAEQWRNGWLHTGDAFRCDDEGNYYFVDRFKDAIRRRGENISSFEVEQCVAEHPDVLEAAAVAVPSEWGEDEVKVVVVLKEGSELSPRELFSSLEPRMPRFMLPRYIEFSAALPKTEATLRVRKVELRAAGVTPQTWDSEADSSKA